MCTCLKTEFTVDDYMQFSVFNSIFLKSRNSVGVFQRNNMYNFTYHGTGSYKTAKMI